MRHYQSLVGQTVSIERIAFTRLLIFFKAIVCLRCYLYRNVADGRSTRPYGLPFLLGYASEVENQFSKCIGRDLSEVWHLISLGAKNLYSTLGKRHDPDIGTDDQVGADHPRGAGSAKPLHR
ncbi:MAG: hypothetical protein QHC40_01095 [Sphingobium sp.]|nr:hypothetical protein [Sphingobium sp.]